MPSPSTPAPPLACDTHMHIYDESYPLAPTAVSAAPRGTADDYEAVQRKLGLERVVVVQPSAYGIDNTVTLNAMAAFGAENARGVAVVDDAASEAELERLASAGICGARFHMVAGGAIPWSMLDTVASKVNAFGWHVQLQLDGTTLPDRDAQIRGWPGTIVIDHVGRFFDPVEPDHPAFRTLLALVDTGRVWVKLSAPYIFSAEPPPFRDVGRLAKALVDAAPERMLWATNWPHPGVPSPPDEGMLLDLLAEWAPDEATRTRILVDNPADLYGF